MMNRIGFLPFVALAITSSAWGQEQKTTTVKKAATKEAKADEPAPAARKFVARRHINVMINNGVDRQLRMLTFESPAPPASILDDGLNLLEEEPEPPQPMMGFDLETSPLERDNFDRWLFGENVSEESRLIHLDQLLVAKVDLAAGLAGLTGSQKEKLRLAGKGDIKRFFDQVDASRKHFELARANFNSGYAALNKLTALTNLYQKGPFGDDSLFAKTLKKIKNDRATR